MQVGCDSFALMLVPARSAANLEFHHTGDQVNEIARKIVATLERQGVRALNPAMGFPMEMDRFGEKTWVVSHKPVAVAAGLGHMGIHRNVIHPKFGNFILLGTILVDAEFTHYSQPIDYNPCLECKLCVAACPVGAISSDGHFNFSACYTHNYREFMSGFTDWVEKIADSKDALDYRRKVSDAESSSTWQSLSFGPNYKAAYCLSVCPAGEDVIGPFLTGPAGLHSGRGSAFAGQGGNALRRTWLGRRRARRPTVPEQESETGQQWAAAPFDQEFLGSPATCFSAGPGRRLGRHVPLHVHGRGADRGHDHH
ncbi:MAG TPA: 4Fe-4S binding protein [Pirellulales bacterium]|nr:4Fe-4S binding protein [Pirellulales bacterium]